MSEIRDKARVALDEAVRTSERVPIHSFRGIGGIQDVPGWAEQEDVQVCHGQDCVAILVRDHNNNVTSGAVLTPANAAKLGRILQTQARHAESPPDAAPEVDTDPMFPIPEGGSDD